MSAAASTTKLRVLCLHGYAQNGEVLRGRIAAYRRAFKSSIEFQCVDAPIVIENDPFAKTTAIDDASESTAVAAPTDASEQQQQPQSQRSWFDFHVDDVAGSVTLTRVDESIAYIAQLCRDHGPFDGVFGFSQGGTIASLVLQHQHEKPDEWPTRFRFGIFVAAPQSRDPRIGNPDLVLPLPTLHVIGDTDAVVAPASSKRLAAGFVDPQIFLHPGGHYVPANKDPKDAFRDFFKRLQAQ